MADTQLPLLGVIMCCTSIPPEQRSELAAIASQMGATHRLDLTSDVTHLIVGDPDTPKYKFVARERSDVKCMLPSWIESLRAKWLEGGEINVVILEIEHKLPTFHGLRVCVTGFDDLEYRKRLEDHITDNGGEYRGNLTKDITHLIAKEASGQKFNYAAQWNIKTVSVEWLDQSLERGMILEESLYHLALPVSERGKNAWLRRTSSTTSLGKRSREQELGSGNARKLRRTASARLSSQNLGLWADININEAKPEEMKKEGWHEDIHKVANDNMAKAKDSGTELDKVIKVDDEKKAATTKLDVGVDLSHDRMPKRGIFQDKMFILNGFDDKKTSVLDGHLRSHGARIITDALHCPVSDIQNLFNLVPHSTLRHDVQTISDVPKAVIAVSELWVERCLFRKEFEEPQKSVINTPFRQFPIPGFEDTAVCSTAFQGIDLLHMSKAVKLMGAKYEEVFTPSANVLVCNSLVAAHDKLRHAQLWGVPAVKAQWLWDCISHGKLLSFESYLVQAIKRESPITNESDRAGALDNLAKPAARNGRKAEFQGNWVPKPLKKSLFSEEEKKQFMKEAPNRIARATFDDGPRSEGPTDLVTNPTKNNNEPTPIYTDDDDTPMLFDDFTTTLDLPQISPALREITPNCSPPKLPPSPIKQNSQLPPPDSSHEDTSLGPAISSLLAHHQRTNSASARPPSSESTDQQPRMYRRRRQLLGRAPSNLSSHSINLSRASSVDTMNTDGLGTPLEASNRSKCDNNLNSNSRKNSKEARADIPTFYSAEQNDDPDREEPLPQMTQLGYEDPDVAAWRERVAVKMAGGKVKEKIGTTPGKCKGAAGAGGLGIAKRTRLATGGR